MTEKLSDRNEREVRRLALERAYAEYASRWDASSASLSGQRAYSWMADSLSGLTRVLEIGTGTGCSTLELLNRGHSVVSIDENPACLEFARRNLCSRGFQAHILFRGTKNFSAAHYQAQYRPLDGEVALPEPRAALLIEGDVCNDDRLVRWLKGQQKFDAVACWLIGTHPYRQYNEIYERRRKRGLPVISSDSDYRFWTQNTVYEIADVVLRSGGKLSVIDRGKSLEQERDREQLYRSHLEQASVTSLSVQGPEQIEELEYFEAPDGVPLRVSADSLISKITLHCVMSVKDSPGIPTTHPARRDD